MGKGNNMFSKNRTLGRNEAENNGRNIVEHTSRTDNIRHASDTNIVPGQPATREDIRLSEARSNSIVNSENNVSVLVDRSGMPSVYQDNPISASQELSGSYQTHRDAASDYYQPSSRGGNVYQSGHDGGMQNSYDSYSQRPRVSSSRDDGFTMSKSSEILHETERGAKIQESQSFLKDRGYDVSNYSREQIDHAAKFGKINGEQLSYNEQQAFQTYSENMASGNSGGIQNAGGGQSRISEGGRMSGDNIFFRDSMFGAEQGQAASGGISEGGHYRQIRSNYQQSGPQPLNAEAYNHISQGEIGHIVDRSPDTFGQHERGAGIVEHQHADNMNFVDNTSKGQDIRLANHDADVQQPAEYRRMAREYNVNGNAPVQQAPTTGTQQGGFVSNYQQEMKGVISENNLGVNQRGYNQPTSHQPATQQAGEPTKRGIKRLYDHRDIARQVDNTNIKNLANETQSPKMADGAAHTSQQVRAQSAESIEIRQAQGGRKRLMYKDGRVTAVNMDTVMGQAPKSATEAFYNDRSLKNPIRKDAKNGGFVQNIDKQVPISRKSLQTFDKNTSLQGTRFAENAGLGARRGDIGRLNGFGKDTDPLGKMNPRGKQLRLENKTGNFATSPRDALSRGSSIRTKKLMVSGKGSGLGLTRQTVTRDPLAGTMKSKSTVRDIWMRRGRNATSLLGRASSINTGGGLPKFFQGFGKAGAAFGKAFTSVGLTVAVVMGSVQTATVPINQTIAMTPLAAHYYTDGTAQTDEEKLTLLGIIKNVVNGKDPTEKKLITQDAVDQVVQWQKDNLESVKASVGSGTMMATFEGTAVDDGGYSTAAAGKSVFALRVETTGRYNYKIVPTKEEAATTIQVYYHDPKNGGVSGPQTLYLGDPKSIGGYYRYIEYWLGKQSLPVTGDDGEYVQGWSFSPNASSVDFGLYQGFDNMAGDSVKRSLINNSSNGEVDLYAVWRGPLTATVEAEVSMPTKEQLENPEVARYFGGGASTALYVYEDEKGEKSYNVDDDTVKYYSQTELLKNIIGMATVATSNDYQHPKEYVNYCLALAQKATGYKDSKTEYSLVKLEGTAGTELGYEWEQDGRTYQADGIMLKATTKVYVNANPFWMMENDPTDPKNIYSGNDFKGWSDPETMQDNINWAISYVELETKAFTEIANVKLPFNVSGFRAAGAVNGSAGNMARIFNQLKAFGFTDAAAYGVLGNIECESGGDPSIGEYGGGPGRGLIQWTPPDAMFAYAAANYGETWPNISLETQVEYLLYEMYELSGVYFTSSNSSAISYFGYDYLDVSPEEFMNLEDVEQATICYALNRERSAAMNEGGTEMSGSLQKRIAAAKYWEEQKLGLVDADSRYLGGETWRTWPGIGSGELAWPVDTKYTTLTSLYGWRIHPIYGDWRYHCGIDMAVPTGEPIYASLGGTVIQSDYNGSAGNWVTIDHGNGLYTEYMHMSMRDAYVGQVVETGQVIGYVGSTGDSTGPHLHFSVYLNGLRQETDNVDPELYL